jgi:amino acid transporter
MEDYKKNSISLKGAVGLGTGVMISAGIFALLGQVAELSGSFFPLMFIIGGIITGFSAYSYIKMSNKFPSAGGIGMFFVKLYGEGTITASASLLMAFSMVINQSLVARTFGTYTLQLFDGNQEGYLIPLLGVILLAIAFVINILSNKFIETFTSLISLVKILGLVLFSIVGLSISNFSLNVAESTASVDPSIIEYIGAIALTILAFKGFTTITNSGSEIKNPHRNVGIAIIISISICVIVYVLLAWAVASNLSITEIINAKDYALAEAAKPAFGVYGLWFTVGLAIIATITGIIASVFAVSRMLAMLTDMQLIPHKHFGMPGNIQKHTLVYTIVIAMALTVLFDLSRIASLGAIYYLIMDIIFHWGVFRKLHKKINANPYIVLFAIFFDTVVLLAFIWIKVSTDLLLIGVAIVSILLIFIVEKFFLRTISTEEKQNA